MNDDIRMRNNYVIFTVQRTNIFVDQIVVDIIDEYLVYDVASIIGR